MRLWAIALAAALTTSASAQIHPAPVYNAVGTYAAGMMSVNLINQPLVFQAQNARQRTATAEPLRDASYTPSPAGLRRAEAGYVARIVKVDPSNARQIEAEMRLHDFGQIYSGIVAPFGLHRGDAADALTAYTLLGWMIANNDLGRGPSPEQVRAVRASVAANMAQNPKFRDPAFRAEFGEELVISFVLMHAGWQSAIRNSRVQPYADQIAAAMAKQMGTDPRRLALTDHGFEARG